MPSSPSFNSAAPARRLAGILLRAVLAAALAGPVAHTAAARADYRPAAGYGALPLAFIRNDGQLVPEVKYYERGARHAVLFTARGVHLTLARERGAGRLVTLGFLGAAAEPEIAARARLPGTANYFIGRDPKRWKTGIPTFGRVSYRGLYPGVDLEFYGNGRELEYDLIVAPGADPARVGLRYEGARALRLRADGGLEIDLGDGRILQRPPYLYQEIAGERREVAGRFRLLSAADKENPGDELAYGFEVGAYDPRYPLVIDPVVLVYSTYLGGSNNDHDHGVAVDSAGNAYVVGETRSLDFPTLSAYQTLQAGNEDVNISKLNADGTALIYSTFIGGSNHDEAYDVAVDAAGNAYVTGSARSDDFPVTASAYQAVHDQNDDAFLVKLDASGSALLYSSYLGGHHEDIGYGIALDASDNAYIAGVTQSTDFPTLGAYQATQRGDRDAFVAKFNPSASGNASLIYSTFIGGKKDETAYSIAVDGAGNAYITGNTESGSSQPYPTTASAFQSNNDGNEEAFITKLSAAGNTLLYSSYLGGKEEEAGYGIAIDGAGGAYITGTTRSDESPYFPTTASAFRTSGAGNQDAFVARFDTTAAGSASLVYSTFLGGRNHDIGYDIAYAGGGQVWVTGQTKFTNNAPLFPTTAGAFQSAYAGNEDVFITRLDTTAAGNAGLIFSTLLGGDKLDYGRGITVDAGGGVYVTGKTQSKGSGSFPTTAGVIQQANAGSEEGFIVKLADTPPLAIATTQLAEATQGGAYSDTLAATGGAAPFSWTVVSGSLPPGLTLNAGTGAITGTASTAGTYVFTVQVTDSASGTDTQVVSITVNAPPAVTTAALGDATVDSGYNETLTASGGTGPYTWSVVSGALPPGLSLNPATGAITGTPTATGTYSFTVQVQDANGVTQTQLLTITVNSAPLITTPSLPVATAGGSYSTTLTSTGGSAPLLWSIAAGSLPPGLTLNAATGEISGTPTVTGLYSFTVQLTDAYGVLDTAALNLNVIAGACTGSSAVTGLGNNVRVIPDARVAVTYAAVTGAGSTCVVISSTPPAGSPSGYAFGTPPQFFDISTTAAHAGQAEVCINYDANRYTSERAMSLFHWNGSMWQNITTSHDTGADLICGLTSSFSPFAVAEEYSTAITLSSFRAVPDGDRVLISWTTSSETDNWGFRVLRGSTAQGPFAPLGTTLIPARGGPGLTVSYTFVDTSIDAGKPYYYRLQDIDTRGLVTLHEAVPLAVAQAPATPKPAAPQHRQAVEDSAAGARPLSDASIALGTVMFPAAGLEDQGRKSAPAERVRATRVPAHAADGQSKSAAPHPPETTRAVSDLPIGRPYAEVFPQAAGSQDETGTADLKPSNAFFVSIKDAQGNLVRVSRRERGNDTVTAAPVVSVTRQAGRSVVRWEVGQQAARGYRLLRAAQDGRFTPVVDYIPNYGDRDPDGIYVYTFIDQGASGARSYEYRLQVLSWGLETARAR